MEPAVGDTLREAREKRGVAIEEVAASTKIQPRLLRAIEAEDWDTLPGEFYAARFIHTYAQYLGLDAGALVAEYERGAAGPGRGGREPARRLGRESARRGGQPPVREGATAGPASREPRVEPTPLDRARRGHGACRTGRRPPSWRGGTGVARARGGLGPGSRSAAGGAGISMRVVGAAVILAAIVAGFIIVVTGSGGGGGHKGVVTMPSAGSGTGTGPGGSNAGGAGDSGGANRQGGSQARKTAELTLTTTAEVWVCLLNAKGNALIKGQILPAGEREGPYRSGAFTVALGNGAVELEVNGKPARMAPSADPVGFKVGRHGGLTPLPEGQRPTCA
jgi:hypothetical protein